jgi:hypothetical protein
MTIDEQVEKRVYNRLRAYDGVEVAGHAPVNSSIASVLSEGEVLADNGEQYSSIQQAVDVSDGFVFVGPGTYYENVVIDKDDFTLQGAGYDTLIDGGTTGIGVGVYADNVNCESFSVRTDTSTGVDGVVSSNSNTALRSIVVREVGQKAIRMNNESSITNCVVKDTGSTSVILGAKGIITSTTVDNSGDHGILCDGNDSIISNCIVRNSNNHGIYVIQGGADSLVGGNRVLNSGDNGIRVYNSTFDVIVYNNRISGSVNADLNNDGTGIVTDANLTGSAN